MEILKRLFLNKTPRNIPDGALTCAKNIVIDDTSSYITNERGLDVAFNCPNDKEFIVGCIPCNNEIVIFTYTPVQNAKGISRIYRKKDNQSAIEIQNHNWKYSGGKITGTFTYNYKGQLIIAVAEYDAYKLIGTGTVLNQVPLKSWNLDELTPLSTYNIEDDIPNIECTYDITTNGNLTCGVYTYFIRFSVDDNNYTKWFQITDDIIIYSLYQKEKPIHSFMVDDNDEIKLADTSEFNEIEINDDGISNYGITLKLSGITAEKYQIGYIVKRNSEVVGRILNTYSSSVDTIDIVNNVYYEEISIDTLLENPHQFFNVHNIINYNNRIYIANYSEYPNEDLADKANNVLLSTQRSDYTSDSEGTTTVNSLYVSMSIAGTTFASSNVAHYTEGGNIYISNPFSFIRNNFVKYITINGITLDTGETEKIPIIKSNRVEVGDGNGQQDVNYLIDNFALYVSNAQGDNAYAMLFSTLGDNANNYDYKLQVNTEESCIHILAGSYDYKVQQDITDAAFSILVIRTLYNKYNQQIGQPTYGWITDTGISFAPSFIHPTGGAHGTSVAEYRTKTLYGSFVIPGNSNRTLIPLQKYNIYVHFVRKDGSCTNGFFVRSLTVNLEYQKPYRYNINCQISSIPDGYVGYFLSYEDVETNATPAYVYSSSLNEGTYDNKITNTSFIYNENNIIGKYINYYQNGLVSAKMDDLETVKKTTIEKHKLFRSTLTIGYIGPCIITTNNEDSIYNKKIKTLYRLTPNIYDTNLYNTDAYRFHPSFVTREKIISYNQELIMNPTSSAVLNAEGDSVEYAIKSFVDYNYSLEPLNCYSLLEDYNKGAVSLVSSEGIALGVRYNSIISPDKLSDLLEIKAAYTSKPSKTYTNYSEDNIDTFDKTIYRSDVVSDESLVNSFRNFQVDNYKNILENKGKITNLVGIGLYFIVHTEYSLFVFDRSNRLNAKAQLEIPDTFSVDYQEVLPSNEGFGGLLDKEESIITKNGYIWLDKTNKYIFNYVDGKINILSADINNLLEDIDIQTVRFAEDIIGNRLLICIYDVNNNTITLSYNFNSNTFISLHDYTFTNNYKTYKVSYLFDSNKDRKRLYVFGDSNTYHNLVSQTDSYYPKY